MSNESKAANVFRNKNYRLVFLGALVSELGALLYNFAVGFYILETTPFCRACTSLCAESPCCSLHPSAAYWGIGSARRKSCMSVITLKAA